MTIITALVLLFAAAYWLRKSPNNQKAVSRTAQCTPGPRNPYDAASINFKACGCSAVKAVGNTRFLTSGKVPKLPLADCTSATCDCRYVRHQDRRSTQGDRRAIYSLRTDLYNVEADSERRTKKGRRESDWLSGDATEELNYAEFEWTS